MTYQPVPTIQFTVAADKLTPETRISRGVKITTNAPTGTICTTYPDAQTACSAVVSENVKLKVAMDAFDTADATFKKARTALGSAVVSWDGAFDVYVSVGERRCTTADQGTGMALDVRVKTKNPFAMPISVSVTYNPKTLMIRVHVKRAPGMDHVALEMSTDPNNPAAWKEIDGNGAVRLIPSPGPGTYWYRAASRTARAKSDFTTPVSVIVK